MVPDKQEVMIHLMEDAWVLVHLDPRKKGVELPPHLQKDKRLILQYGYNMPMPIYDLVVDERGISATLSFQRVAHATFVPWSAVFGMTDGDKRVYVWEADIPPDLIAEAAQEAERASQGIRDIRDKAQEKSHDKGGTVTPLRQAAPPESASTPEPAPQAPGKPGKKPRPNHLKLVD
jgi:hypothetical protein